VCAQVDDEIPAGLDSIHEAAEEAAAVIAGEATPVEPHHDRPVPPGFVRDRKLAYSTVRRRWQKPPTLYPKLRLRRCIGIGIASLLTRLTVSRTVSRTVVS